MKSITVIEYCLFVRRRHVGMADDADSKSVAGNRVRVQVPLPAVNELVRETSIHSWVLIFLRKKDFGRRLVILSCPNSS